MYSHHDTAHMLPGGAFKELHACGVLPEHNLLSRMGNTHTWIHSHPLLQDPMYRLVIPGFRCPLCIPLRSKTIYPLTEGLCKIGVFLGCKQLQFDPVHMSCEWVR